MKPKTCQRCGIQFLPLYNVTHAYWAKRRFCGTACMHASQRGMRLPTYGQPMKSLAERFWPKVNKGGEDECWLWTGAITFIGGYGRLGNRANHGGDIRVHRLSYELNVGPIPDGSLVCHHCDTPLCVNPKHLFLGTHADNSADMVSKGRGSDKHGEANPNAKLTPADVAVIRQLRADGLTQQVIANRFGVTQVTISGICTGRLWKSLEV